MRAERAKRGRASPASQAVRVPPPTDRLQCTGDVMGLRERQKLQRSERILTAAAELFNERGYDQVTIEEIALRAEVSPATVHNYYETKGKLLLEIVKRGDQAIFEYGAELAKNPAADARRVLNDLLEMTSRHSLAYLDHKVWRHAIAISITREDVYYGTEFAEVHNRFVSMFEAVVLALRERCALPRLANATILGSLLYKVQHALFIEMIGDAEVDFARYLAKQQAHVDFIVDTLGVPAPTSG